MSYSLFVDLDRCIGCYACEVACKQEHDLPVGPRWIRVFQDGPKETSAGLQLDFCPQLCKQCEDPKCGEVCPENAISKNPEGPVLIDFDRCNGCKACIEACPFELMGFDEVSGKASKCDFCVGRLVQGLEPSCVAFCPGKALVLQKGIGVSESMRIRRLI